MIENLITGFGVSLSLQNLLFCFIGVFLGQIVGVLPGLGPTATMALLLTLTFKLDLTTALIMLSGIYYGVQYGGTITSVLFKIPGEASTVVTVLDGYPMALQGRAGKALGIAAFGSFIAGTLGTVVLSFLAPPLARIALMFGYAEFASLMILGLVLVVYLGSGSTRKAMLMGALGLAIGAIGMDPVTGYERFNFGSQTLVEGIDIAIMAMGLFGIGEILYMAENVAARSSRDVVRCPSTFKELLPNLRDWKDSIFPILRGIVIGFPLGILPGGGGVISSFASYATEKKLSKHPEKFGRGAIEGVAGPETANNAAISGCFIPLLTLGIPSNCVMALLMGAFMIHGVIPGPFIIKEHPQLFWGIITSMYIGNVILLILNIPLIRIFVKIMSVPFGVLSPLIVLICVIGAYSLYNNPVDIIVMMIFGGLGYIMRKFDYEAAPLMLAFILGPLLEKSIRQSLIYSHGNPSIFFTRPISLLFIVAVFLLIISPLLIRMSKSQRAALMLNRIKAANKD